MKITQEAIIIILIIAGGYAILVLGRLNEADDTRIEDMLIIVISAVAKDYYDKSKNKTI